MNVTEDKWLKFPDEKKVELLANIEKMQDLTRRKIELYGEMRRSLVHHWMKDSLMSVQFTEKTFVKFVRQYYRAIEQGDECFFLEGGQEVLVSYAKYLIEYLEPQLVAVSKHAFVNHLERQLRDIRAQHKRNMKAREEG